MDKRYQVFISSTREDLKEERRTVADTLLRSRFIPIGMEQFTAASDDAWSLIRRYLDECDYYVVIIAKTYGSTRADGISYTEAEYDYAVHSGIPVLAFVYVEDESSSARMDESDPVKAARLAAFRQKIDQVRVRDTWRDQYELAYKVSSALDNLVRDHPAIGWIRGDVVPDAILDIVQSVAEPCRRLGVSAVSEDGVAGESLKRSLAGARSIRIFSSSAFRLLDTYRGQMTEALSRGCSVQLLVPKPGGQFLADLEEFEAVHIDRGLSLETELEVVKTRLLEALSQAVSTTSSNVGQVAIGYFTTHLRSTLVLCDDSWGWLTITLPPFRATETMSLELRQTSYSPLLKTCIAHFERSWAIVRQRGDVEVLRSPQLS